MEGRLVDRMVDQMEAPKVDQKAGRRVDQMEAPMVDRMEGRLVDRMEAPRVGQRVDLPEERVKAKPGA